MDHIHFMRRCLQLAEQGRGKVGINPLVGAVLARGDAVIAEGYYTDYGAEHAEASLLANFTEDIQPADILYVNLEPCCHTGMRPPCTDVILARGVKTVVYGMRDPDSRVAGKGIAALKSAGVKVIGPLFPIECARLNRGYVSLRTQRRPWITLKSAFTSSGTTAHPDGSPLKITSPEQDAWSHAFLRARHDAILVGIGTILRDDPLLTVRLSKKVDQFFQPWQVILDPHRQLPNDARVRGDRFLHITDLPCEGGIFVWQELWKTLTTPRENFPGVSSLLVEGGPKTWEVFRSAGVVDQEVLLLGA